MFTRSQGPNMNYWLCTHKMCQNTQQSLEQLLNYMHEDGYFLRELSREERRAYDTLYHLCNVFVHRAEELAEDEERYIAFDESGSSSD